MVDVYDKLCIHTYQQGWYFYQYNDKLRKTKVKMTRLLPTLIYIFEQNKPIFKSFMPH